MNTCNTRVSAAWNFSSGRLTSCGTMART